MFRHDFGIIFWFHWGFVALFYASPFLFNSWYILAGFLVLLLQDAVLGYCVLSRWQFKYRSNAQGFFQYYFEKWEFADPKSAIRAIERSQPFVVLFSMLWQWGLGFQPVIA